MNRAGRLPHVQALIEQVGDIERFTELEVEAVKLREIPLSLVERLAETPPHGATGTLGQMKAKAWGVPSLEPDDMTPAMRRVLELLCRGQTEREIAAQTGFPYNSVRDLGKALRGLFRARNHAHLCALAVARGYVSFAAEEVPT